PLGGRHLLLAGGLDAVYTEHPAVQTHLEGCLADTKHLAWHPGFLLPGEFAIEEAQFVVGERCPSAGLGVAATDYGVDALGWLVPANAAVRIGTGRFVGGEAVILLDPRRTALGDEL